MEDDCDILLYDKDIIMIQYEVTQYNVEIDREREREREREGERYK